jgi:hypothetical protein
MALSPSNSPSFTISPPVTASAVSPKHSSVLMDVSDTTTDVIPTIIHNESIEKIYAFSDIHGDPDALIVLLRDCAKVII